jgi:hypothetical protein
MLRGRCGEDEGVYGNHSWRRPLGTDRVIYGIDFSGAQDAGNKIWIARGVSKGEELLIEECFSARELLNSEKELLPCLCALVSMIQLNPNAAFGFDFPFGLPSSLVSKNTWEEFVLAFPTRFNSSDDFKAKCFSEAEQRELRRSTDKDAQTPHSPYNLRLFKQTYYGISKVLFPLVRDRIACILPFQEAVAGKPWILEICPASTLKHLMEKEVPSYKASKELHRENRRQILADVMKAGVSFGKNAEIKDKIIANMGGDALDSVIAALAAFKAVQDQEALIPETDGYWKIEGYVYA